MASRPLVTIQSFKGETEPVPLPAVLVSPIRSDVVDIVHGLVRKNKRQPYAVSRIAGEQTSASSWGTGRAVSRIPRVAGGGTSRSGQGAFGNMCRGGRMFGPTKVWRRWHVRVAKGQRRYATCSALAASAVPALVMARGHQVSNVPELPLVVADADVAPLTKTKEALALLKKLGVGPDLERVKKSKHIRAGKGKARNRRYVKKRGPLVVHTGGRFVNALRNIMGVDLCDVSRLNLLSLAPGGHVGRFVIFTESAFKKLDSIFGTPTQDSEVKRGFRPPVAVMTNADLSRVINSDEVQSVLRPKQVVQRKKFKTKRRNPLENNEALFLLNPYARTKKRNAMLSQEKAKENRAKKLKEAREAKKKVAKNKEFEKLLFTPTVAPERGIAEVTFNFQ